MGVHNLHGVGGWIGALTAAIIVGSGTNVIAAVGVVVITMVTGAATGAILRATRGKIADEDLFNDKADFIMNEAPSTEVSP